MKKIIALCCLVWIFALPQASAAEVKGFVRGTKSVIQFTFSAIVPYSAKIAGGSLIIKFDQPQNDMNMDSIKAGLPDLVNETMLSGDGKTLIVGLNQEMQLKDKAEGGVITLVLAKPGDDTPDFPPPEKAKDKEKQHKEGAAPATKVDAVPIVVRTGQHPGFYRVVFEWPEKTGYNLTQTDNKAHLVFAAPAKIAPRDWNKIKSPQITGVKEGEDEDGNTMVDFDLAVPLPIEHSARGKSIVLDFKLADAAPAPKTAAPAVPLDPKEEAKSPMPSERARAESAAPQNPAQAAAPINGTVPVEDLFEAKNVPVKVTRKEKEASFQFAWPLEVGAAVFRRAGFVWIVFDRTAKLDLDAESAGVANNLGGIENLHIPSATVLRIHTVAGLEPSLSAEGNNWQIDLKPQKLHPNVAIPADGKDLGGGKFGVFLPVPQAGRVLSLDDPEVGDQLFVATLKSAGRGINGEREYPEFTLLASVQGIAVNPKTDLVQLRPDFEGFLITSDKGLLLSSVAAQNEQEKKEQEEIYGPLIPKAAGAPPMLKYAEWRGDPRLPFFDKEKALLAQLAALDPSQRESKRLELARLYFASGWMEEALAVLNVVAAENEAMLKSPEFIAVRGVIKAMQHNYKEANEDLKDQRFDNQPDIATWRGVLSVQQSDWSAADQYFSLSDLPNIDQPPLMRKFSGLSYIESEVNNRHFENAARLIEAMEKDTSLGNVRDILNYWRGEILMSQEKPEEAVKLWEKVAANEEAYARPRAEFALIRHGAESGSLKRDEIIARLERLRFAWRGDKFEFDVLHMLGIMQIEDGLYREGLFTLNRAVTNYADQPYTAELTDLMGQTFKKLFLDGAADNMPPLTALGLFDEFRDLTPTGPEGDTIIQRLADRLTSVDLLNRAEELLQHQVSYRLSGNEKARVGAKLAFVYLLDRKPDEAIKALDLSNAADMTAEVNSNRRLLRARALFDKNKAQEALDLIAPDSSRDADVLRTDIYWRMQNWRMAAQKFHKLITLQQEEDAKAAEAKAAEAKEGDPPAEPPKLAPQTAQWILSYALALALDGDNDQLKAARKTYWAAMKTATQFDAFDIITQTDVSQNLSISDLSGKLEEAAKIESFMGYYREKIKKGGLN